MMVKKANGIWRGSQNTRYGKPFEVRDKEKQEKYKMLASVGDGVKIKVNKKWA